MKNEESYTLKEMMSHRFDEQDKHLVEIKSDVKEVVKQATATNGRVTKLEEWSNEARQVIENTTTITNAVAVSYKVDRARLWTAIGLLVFFGGTIITLAIGAINSKIKESISQAFASYEVK